MTGGARWLVVVNPGQLDLYHRLEQRFGDVAFVDVIVDRRKGERRQVRAAVERELRRDERRQRATPKQHEEWTLLGYRLVRCAAPPP